MVLHANLTCRLVIGIREASQSSSRMGEAFELSAVASGDNTVSFARMTRESGWVDIENRPGHTKL